MFLISVAFLSIDYHNLIVIYVISVRVVGCMLSILVRWCFGNVIEKPSN